MTASLFRREVLDARRRTWLGGISLAQPLPVWLLTGFAVSAAAAIVLFLVFGEYTRRSRVVGQLVPDLGLSTIVAPVAGVVTRPLPNEGEQVRRGQPVVVIATSRATTGSGDMTAGMLDRLEQRRQAALRSFAAERRLLELQADGYAVQMAAARLELEQVESAIAIERRRARIAEDLLAHFRQLAAQKYVTRLQLAQQEQASLEQAAAVQALQRQATALQRDMLRLEQGLRELSARESAQAAARTRELAALGSERLQIEAGGEVLVEAPLDGLVASSLGEAGQAVQAGQPLLDLLPTGSVLLAQLLVPSRAVGFLESGDAVLLRFQAFPHQKFGHHRGRVLQVSRNTLDPRALATLTGDARAAEPIYRVLVELEAQSVVAYGKAQALRPGMVVEADILGERRKLYEWLLEPLYSLTGRL
jgi:membrane fusion protein